MARATEGMQTSAAPASTNGAAAVCLVVTRGGYRASVETDIPEDWLASRAEQVDRAEREPLMNDREADAIMCWSLDICMTFLGAEWLAREIDGRKGSDYLMLGGDTNAIESAGERAMRLCRVHTLATHLLAIRQVDGFEHYVTDARTRSMVEVVAEMRAVLDMVSRGARVEILPRRSGVKTPDARMTLRGTEVLVEVKSKLEREVAAYRSSTISSSLKKARSQLPTDRPGLVYLQIPPA